MTVCVGSYNSVLPLRFIFHRVAVTVLWMTCCCFTPQMQKSAVRLRNRPDRCMFSPVLQVFQLICTVLLTTLCWHDTTTAVIRRQLVHQMPVPKKICVLCPGHSLVVWGSCARSYLKHSNLKQRSSCIRAEQLILFHRPCLTTKL